MNGGPPGGAAPSSPLPPWRPAYFPLVQPAAVVRKHADGTEDPPTEDRIAVEEPLELQLGDLGSTVLLRTPGHDEDLALGFLWGEGSIESSEDVLGCERLAVLPEAVRENTMLVRLRPGLPKQGGGARHHEVSSSCGACGRTSLGALRVLGAPLDASDASRTTVSPGVLVALPGQLREAQLAFGQTGGLHAAGLFDTDGRLVLLREDVGRHNAVDKVVGWAVREKRLPLTGHVLLVSGRVSYDLAQKAVAAGIPVLAAIGAPSSMAVEIARQFGLTLIGFLREVGFNIYTHEGRIGPVGSLPCA